MLGRHFRSVIHSHAVTVAAWSCRFVGHDINLNNSYNLVHTSMIVIKATSRFDVG